MAEVRPFNALHYELRSVPSLGTVTAPPYDVIDGVQRAELLQRSPFNVVELDLPMASGEGSDRYMHAAETLEEWILTGILTQDPFPTIWPLTRDLSLIPFCPSRRPTRCRSRCSPSPKTTHHSTTHI